MTMAARLQSCLAQHQSRYEVLWHTPSHTSRESARRAGIPPERMAKPVILNDTQGHRLMAVLPASRQLNLDKLRQSTRRNWRLAHESEFGNSFADCATGAIPAVGSAFGMETLIDASLASGRDTYFEAGDHEGIVHMTTEQYLKLMPDAQQAAISE